jgi:hypothetical protein
MDPFGQGHLQGSCHLHEAQLFMGVSRCVHSKFKSTLAKQCMSGVFSIDQVTDCVRHCRHPSKAGADDSNVRFAEVNSRANADDSLLCLNQGGGALAWCV